MRVSSASSSTSASPALFTAVTVQRVRARKMKDQAHDISLHGMCAC